MWAEWSVGLWCRDRVDVKLNRGHLVQGPEVRMEGAEGSDGSPDNCMDAVEDFLSPAYSQDMAKLHFAKHQRNVGQAGRSDRRLLSRCGL